MSWASKIHAIFIWYFKCWLFLDFNKIKMIEKGKATQTKWGILIISLVVLTLYFANNGCLPPVINISSSRSRTRRMGWPVLQKTNCRSPFISSICPSTHLSIQLSTYPPIYSSHYFILYPHPFTTCKTHSSTLHPPIHFYYSFSPLSVHLSIYVSIYHTYIY